MREAWVGYETRVGYEAWVGLWSLGWPGACGSRAARCQACLAYGTRLYVARVTNYGEIAGMLVRSCMICGERPPQTIARAYTTQTKDAYERTE